MDAILCTPPHCTPQVVFTGPTVAAEAHFSSLGHSPASPAQSVADHVLDLVIKVSGCE
jgi:hypothetical protein